MSPTLRSAPTSWFANITRLAPSTSQPDAVGEPEHAVTLNETLRAHNADTTSISAWDHEVGVINAGKFAGFAPHCCDPRWGALQALRVWAGPELMPASTGWC